MSHSHDDALLYDLVDGRLGERAAEDLRRRLRDEPSLRASWEEIQRMRAGLRALPVPAVPGDFLARVRAQAGAAGATAPAGRVLRLRRARPWMAAAAAVALAALLGEVWLTASTPERAPGTQSQEVAREAPRARDDAPAPDAATGTVARREKGMERAARATPAGPPAGPFRAPGGAIPPGLREPSDAPPPPPATEPGEAQGHDTDGRAGGEPPPAAGTRGPPLVEAGGGAASGGLAAKASAPPVTAPPLTPSAPAPARPEASPRGHRPETRGSLEGESKGERPLAGKDGRKDAPEEPASFARDVADETLILRAGSADEARAEVGLLLHALEVGSPLPALELSRSAAEAPATAGDASGWRTDAGVGGPGPAEGADRDGKAREAAPAALLFLRLDLGAAQWARLAAAVPSGEATRATLADKAAPAGATGAPPTAETPRAAGPASAPAPARADARSAPRRVRIVVLPR
jgi:negative regulator of sigma E activity